jgi:hypothetical protein
VARAWAFLFIYLNGADKASSIPNISKKNDALPALVNDALPVRI